MASYREDEFRDAGSGDVESAADFAAVPDAFQRLWTPHRLAYIKDGQQPAKDECPFCRAPSRTDEQALIVARGELVYAVLNLYPYNSGHLMTVPYRHVADYTDLTGEETAETASYTKASMEVLREVSNAQGFNIGMNQGGVAGAGAEVDVSARRPGRCPAPGSGERRGDPLA